LFLSLAFPPLHVHILLCISLAFFLFCSPYHFLLCMCISLPLPSPFLPYALLLLFFPCITFSPFLS
jgi:hypothetical protein